MAIIALKCYNLGTMAQKFLITTAIDYVNDVIHIGHAYEKIVADCYVRFLREVHGAENVHFVTGTDEHGQKVQKAAEAKGVSPKQFADEISAADKQEMESLQISFDRFIRTTDEDHVAQVNDFWQKVYDAGFIYQGEYTGLYCEGDEAFVTASDLVHGKCLNHPHTVLKTVTEKNYFFKWSEFTNFLGDHIAKNPNFIPVEVRRNEMLGFLKGGLNDLTISRSKEAVSWGIAVPSDPGQVIYVWFDALINYLTYGLSINAWDEDTTIVHFVGKDILRWHTLLWPAMLNAAGYNKLPNTVVAHGFLGLNGQKISKSIGNVIRPSELVEKYGVDVVRYYLLRYTRLDSDADLDLKHLEEVYNADLANGLGNLVSRVAKLCDSSQFKNTRDLEANAKHIGTKDYLETNKPVKSALESFNFSQSLIQIWLLIDNANQYIDERKPWSLAKNESFEELHSVLQNCVDSIIEVAQLLKPFMPNTADKILDQYQTFSVKARMSLFPRLEIK